MILAGRACRAGAPLRAGHWGLALGVALTLHAALALLLFQPPAPGALAGGRGGIQVGLGPAGGAAGAPGTTSVEEAPGVEDPLPQARDILPPSAEVRPPEAAPPEPLQDAAVAEAAAGATPPEETPIVGAPVDAAPVDAAPVEEAVAEAARKTPPKPVVKPRARLKPRAVAAPSEPDRQVQAEPQPAPQPAGPQTAAKTAGPSGAAPAQGRPGAAVNGTNGKAGTGATAAAGTGKSSGGGGTPGDYIDYKQRIMSWLERHKEYPRRAKLRRQEGAAHLVIAVDGSGKLLDYRIDKSAGYKLLDQEVVAMVQRAQPLPAAPSGAGTARYEFSFLVDFGLR
ncbi:energy transducer TonB family protein [Pelagibius marinus]|uniref:energy transducer TonB family protein n=1 Tax=Pelagibius marinus TaxID=2762760 RepID=UPI0018730576|nr:energy transducer TonB [Pelagibius marinus]